MGVALLFAAPCSAQVSVDDYLAGRSAGYGDARRSNDYITLPTDRMPPDGSDWGRGFRQGYENGQEENRDRACFYGVSPFPCR